MAGEIEAARLKATLVADVEKFKAAMDGARIKVEETQRSIQREGKTTTEQTSKMSAVFDKYGKSVDQTKSPLNAFADGLGKLFPQTRGFTNRLREAHQGTDKVRESFQKTTSQTEPLAGGLGKVRGGFMGGAGGAMAFLGPLALIAVVGGVVIKKLLDITKAIISVIFNFIRQTQVFQFGMTVLKSFVDFILGIFLRAFVEGLQGGATGAGGAFSKFALTVRGLTEKFAELAPEVVKLTDALLPLVTIVVQLATRFLTWIMTGNRLKIILALILTAVLALASPLIALAVAAYLTIKAIQFLATAFSAMWTVTKGLVGFLADTLKPIFEGVWDVINRIVGVVAGIFTTVWQNIQGVLTGALTPFEALWNIGEDLWDTLSGIAGVVGGVFTTVWETIQGVLDDVWDALHGVWNMIANFLEPAFAFFRPVIDAVAGALGWLWTVLEGIWDALVGIAGAIGGALGGLGEALGGAGEAAGGFADWLNPFQEGGPVYGTGPALLHAGEFVLPAGTAEGISRLLQFYGGGEGARTTNVAPTINITINTSEVGSSLFGVGQTVATEIERAARGAVG